MCLSSGSCWKSALSDARESHWWQDISPAVLLQNRGRQVPRGGCWPWGADGWGVAGAGADKAFLRAEAGAVETTRAVGAGPQRSSASCRSRENSPEAESKPSHPAVSLQRPLPTNYDIAPLIKRLGLGLRRNKLVTDPETLLMFCEK